MQYLYFAAAPGIRLNLSFFIARRFLARQKGAFSAFILRLAMVATALSVATMIVAVAVITGFQGAIREKLFSFWGQVHITPHNPNPSNLITPQPIVTDNKLEAGVRSLPDVWQVAPYVVRPAILKSGGAMEGIQLKGVGPRFRFVPSIRFSGGKIDYSDTAYSKGIILSETTAARLKLKTGSSIFLYFLEPGMDLPRIRKATVAGLFHTGMEDIDRNFGICDIRLLQRVNGWERNQVNGYQVDVRGEKNIEPVADRIFHELVPATLTTSTIRDIYPNVFDWLSLQNVNVILLLTIMGIIAVINLASALLILMVDRARTVGLLQALGLPPSALQSVFVQLAAFTGLAGVLAGTLLALGLCFVQQRTGFMTLPEDTYYMRQVPVQLVWWKIVLIDVVTVLICLLVMWLPALYIRRIQPARVLQFK